MSKRKRPDMDDSSPPPPAPAPSTSAEPEQLDTLLLGRQQRDVLHTFNLAATQLARAFKLAKGFERQKLGRRKKTAIAARAEADLARIEAEIAASKGMENEAAARLYLAKQLVRVKRVVEAPALHPRIVREARTGLKGSAALNVHARLCGSVPVREAVEGVVALVWRELGLEVEKGREEGDGRKKRLRARDYEEVDEMCGKIGKGVRRIGEQEEEEEEEEEAEDEYERDGGSVGEFDDNEDVEMSDVEELERRLAAEGMMHDSGLRKRPRHDLGVEDVSDSGDESEADIPARGGATAVKPNKSAFLPSLTLGGYISGSGSDIEEEVDVAPRKNRRGQRARQKIWEQKFGARAKHLLKEDRNKGWDAKRGATTNGPRDFKKGGRMAGNGRSGVITGRQQATSSEQQRPKKQHKDDSGPLHPSWEAAKRAKEKKAVPVAFSGKKISFD